MIKFETARRRLGIALSAACLTGAIASPASAQGFFDQLFGGGSAQPAQPSFSYDPTQPAPDLGLTPLKRKKVAIVHTEPAQQRQKTTDLWHDKTLRPGDAIMMKDGLHVYNGPESSKHTAKQFVALDRARHVASKTRVALAAVDTTRNDPLLKKAYEPDTLASGRSAAVGTPINKGYKITDARGASIRYVGP